MLPAALERNFTPTSTALASGSDNTVGVAVLGQRLMTTAVGGTVTVFVSVALAPWLSTTVSLTVYVPCAAYVCDGLVAVELVASPKSQVLLAILPSGSVLRSARVTVRLTASTENSGSGA